MAKIAEPPSFEEASSCRYCQSYFTAFRRRHHCRSCGKSFCSDHSANMQHLPQFGIFFNVRVCDACKSENSGGKPPVEYLGREETLESRKKAENEVAVEESTAHDVVDVVDSFKCMCGMPLCICERPEASEPQSKPVAVPPQNNEIRQTPGGTSLSRSQKQTPSVSSFSKQNENRTQSFLFSKWESQASLPQSYPASGEGLREAVKNGDVNSVRDLLNKGVDPLYVDKQGMSLLHVAAVFNKKEIALLLMESGADPLLKNAQGETAMECAQATLAYQMKERLKK